MRLVDSNVLVAIAVEGHPHRAASIGFLRTTDRQRILVSAHSLAEVFNTLTRRNGFYGFTAAEASAFIDAATANLTTVALSAAQCRDAIRRFAATGRTGPRLYDFLIGATAEVHRVGVIVTWNVRDFEGLFPNLRIVTPEAALTLADDEA